VSRLVENITAKSTSENDVLVTKGTISDFQKNEIGTVYPRKKELTAFTLDLTWASQRDAYSDEVGR
jgi:hypothetical protein